ncbi:MAG: TIGR00266 family protein [Myxococcota bacterium]
MKHSLLQRPDFGMVRVEFESVGETIVAEAGAMVARDTGIAMKTSMRGGLLAAAQRSLLGGESLFMNTFSSTAPGQTIYFAAAPEGDIVHRRVAKGETLYAQSGSFLCAGPGVILDTKWQGMRGFFSGEGLFLLRVTGEGDLFLASYGGIHEIDVARGYVCDTGHVVAFTDGLDYRVRPVAGLKGLFFSGEGLVCEFSGRGQLLVQTRNPSTLAMFLHPFRRVRPRQ